MLSSRAIIFIHLAKDNASNKTQSQIKLLKRLINETDAAITSDEDLEASLNKIIYAYSYAIANGKVLGASAISSLAASKNSLILLKDELLNFALNAKNYKYFLVFIVSACLMICFIVASLCMTVYFYKQRNSDKASRSHKKRINSSDIYNFATDKSNFNNEFERLNQTSEKSNRNSSGSNSSAASTTSSTSLTKTTNSSASTTNNNQQNKANNLVATSVSSVSPASTNNSSELNHSVNNQKFYTTNYESLQLNYSSIDSSNTNTLDRPKQIGASNAMNNGNTKSSTFIYSDEPNYSSVFKVIYFIMKY